MVTISREDIAMGASVIGALGVLLWLIYTIVQYKRMVALQEKQDRLLAEIESQAQDAGAVAFKVRNLELAQCANPQVAANPQLAALLKCPRNRTTDPSSVGAFGAPPVVGTLPPAMMTHGGSAVQMGDAANARFTPHMPNYGFFGTGPHGLSPPQVGMPAFSSN